MAMALPQFQFVARTRDGEIRRGTEPAASAGALVASLRERQWTVVDVRQTAASAGTNWLEALTIVLPSRWWPVTSYEMEVGMSQLAVMLRSGLTLLAALGSVAEQAPRTGTRRLWERVAASIREGHSLAEAMERTRRFPSLVVQLVAVGEQTGGLENAFRQAAIAMERRRDLRTKLISALMYPTIVLVAALSVASFMVLFVIPKMEKFLNQLGRKLPWMTQSLLDLSAWIRLHAVDLTAGAIILTLIAIMTYCTTPGRLWFDRWVMHVPVLGNLFRLSGTALAARSLGTLLDSGVSLLESLRTVERLLGNRWLRARVDTARNRVIAGGSLADGFRGPLAFTPMLAAMAAVGEQSGTLDEVMAETARFHEEQLATAIRRFSAIIEPVIIVVIGAIVGYVYIAFFVALFAAAGGN